MSRIKMDATREPRAGEELPIAELEAYLKAHAPELSGTIEVEQFPKGHSNLTYLLRIADRELVLRRPPFGAKIKSGHDMGREFKVLSGLNPVFDRAPKPWVYCEDESVLGASFYIMERKRGIILRQGVGVSDGLTEDLMRKLSTSLIDTLADVHNVDIQAAGLDSFGKPEGYVERQVSGWTRRYQAAQTDDVPVVEQVGQWLAANMPPEAGAALIHNDYKYDNVVLNPDDWTQIIAILDWEMATVGDPLMDLGTTLGYWLQKDDPEPLKMLPIGPTHLPGNLSRQDFVERYSKRTGRNVDHVLFYYAYALFKIGVIVQQIYARFVKGHTQDPRFAVMGKAMEMLMAQAARAIDKGQIYDLNS